MRNDVRTAQRRIWEWILMGDVTVIAPDSDSDSDYEDCNNCNSRCWSDFTNPLFKFRYAHRCLELILSFLGDYQKRTRRV